MLLQHRKFAIINFTVEVTLYMWPRRSSASRKCIFLGRIQLETESQVCPLRLTHCCLRDSRCLCQPHLRVRVSVGIIISHFIFFNSFSLIFWIPNETPGAKAKQRRPKVLCVQMSKKRKKSFNFFWQLKLTTATGIATRFARSYSLPSLTPLGQHMRTH